MTWRAAGFRPNETLSTPEDGVHPGQFGFDSSEGLEGGEAVAAEVIAAGTQGEGERVEDQIPRFEAVAVNCQPVDPVGNPHLPFDVASLAFLIDEQANHCRSVLPGQGHHPVEPGSSFLTVLEVGRVEHGPPADPLQTGVENLRLGGIEHDGNADLAGEPPRQLIHVPGAVPSDIVDAEVDQVGAFADLIASHLDTTVPVFGQQCFAKLLGAVGVGSFADDQERCVLAEGTKL